MVSRVAAASPINIQISLPNFTDVLHRSLLEIQTTTDLYQENIN